MQEYAKVQNHQNNMNKILRAFMKIVAALAT